MNNAKDFKWTDEATDRMRAMHAAGVSYNEMAKILSEEVGKAISRLAVQGRAYRIGLMRPLPKRPEKAPKTIKPAFSKVQAKAPSDAPARPAVSASERQKQIDAIATDPKVIGDPGFSGCRWPLHRTADDGQILHCCNPRSALPYCEDHARLAHQKLRSPEQIAADAKTWASNVVRAGVRQAATRHFNTPLVVAS